MPPTARGQQPASLVLSFTTALAQPPAAAAITCTASPANVWAANVAPTPVMALTVDGVACAAGTVVMSTNSAGVLTVDTNGGSGCGMGANSHVQLTIPQGFLAALNETAVVSITVTTAMGSTSSVVYTVEGTLSVPPPPSCILPT